MQISAEKSQPAKQFLQDSSHLVAAGKCRGKANSVAALRKQNERAAVTLISGDGIEAIKARQVSGIEPDSSRPQVLPQTVHDIMPVPTHSTYLKIMFRIVSTI